MEQSDEMNGNDIISASPQSSRSGPTLPAETEEYLRQVEAELKALEGFHLVRALAERGKLLSLAFFCVSPSRRFVELRQNGVWPVQGTAQLGFVLNTEIQNCLLFDLLSRSLEPNKTENEQ